MYHMTISACVLRKLLLKRRINSQKSFVNTSSINSTRTTRFAPELTVNRHTTAWKFVQPVSRVGDSSFYRVDITLNDVLHKRKQRVNVLVTQATHRHRAVAVLAQSRCVHRALALRAHIDSVPRPILQNAIAIGC